MRKKKAHGLHGWRGEGGRLRFALSFQALTGRLGLKATDAHLALLGAKALNQLLIGGGVLVNAARVGAAAVADVLYYAVGVGGAGVVEALVV